MPHIQQIIKTLNLLPHPEGGYYKETYRSAGSINSDSLSADYSGKRNYSTCIYFLLTSDTFSAFHRIKQDEIWHFYDGSPLLLHTISEKGLHSQHIIGKDITNGQTPQLVVNGGDWFAATVIGENSYSLVGCTVAPGFDFADFELAEKDELTALFPEHKGIIGEFTKQ